MNGRTDDCWIKMLTEDIPDTILEKNFCIDKVIFFELVEILRPMMRPDTNSPNYRSLSTEKKIAVVSYYLKDGIVVDDCKYI